MLSSTPMSPDAFYEAFLSILQVHGFVAVSGGKSSRSCPMPTPARCPTIDLPSASTRPRTSSITQVIAVKNVSAAQLVPVLRPLIPQYGHMAAYPTSQHPDHLRSRQQREPHDAHHPAHRSGGRQRRRIIALQNASASRGRARRQLALPAAGPAEGGGASHAVVADDRSNSVLIGGDKNAAAAHQGADRASRHAARKRRRHAGALPAITRTPRRSPPSSRSRSARTVAVTSGAAAGRRRRGGGVAARPTEPRRSGRSRRPTRW